LFLQRGYLLTYSFFRERNPKGEFPKKRKKGGVGASFTIIRPVICMVLLFPYSCAIQCFFSALSHKKAMEDSKVETMGTCMAHN
jgi:hypothetical protein